MLRRRLSRRRPDLTARYGRGSNAQRAELFSATRAATAAVATAPGVGRRAKAVPPLPETPVTDLRQRLRSPPDAVGAMGSQGASHFRHPHSGEFILSRRGSGKVHFLGACRSLTRRLTIGAVRRAHAGRC